MSRGPCIRKRNIEFGKHLKLVRTFDQLYFLIHGERDGIMDSASPDRSANNQVREFKETEEKEQLQKISQMFMMKKSTVAIPGVKLEKAKDGKEENGSTASTADIKKGATPAKKENPFQSSLQYKYKKFDQ
jgi:hypothetical protein